MILKAEPLSRDAFAPFGDVLACDESTSFLINDGFTTRNHALAKVETDADTVLSIFQGRVRPLTASMLERHPLGSQAFMPLNGQSWLVLVASEPKPSACKLFLCGGDQGVNYHANIWHHPLLVLEKPQDFLVVDRQGEGENLEEAFFEQPLELSL